MRLLSSELFQAAGSNIGGTERLGSAGLMCGFFFPISIRLEPRLSPPPLGSGKSLLLTKVSFAPCALSLQRPAWVLVQNRRGSACLSATPQPEGECQAGACRGRGHKIPGPPSGSVSSVFMYLYPAFLPHTGASKAAYYETSHNLKQQTPMDNSTIQHNRLKEQIKLKYPPSMSAVKCLLKEKP